MDRNLETSSIVLTVHDFDDAFSEENIELTYKKLKNAKHLIPGMDRVSENKFEEELSSNVHRIHIDIMSGGYKFIIYREILKLKRRDTPPRSLCIPSIADRIVIRIIKEAFLKPILPLGKKYIEILENIKEDIRLSDNNSYFKTDISNFYGSINHQSLINILVSKRLDKRVINLIKQVIEVTPDGIGTNMEVGIPQGISISNALAELYAESFDKNMKTMVNNYYRYVDDILILYNDTFLTSGFVRKKVEEYLNILKLEIPCSAKTVEGKLSDKNGFEFLGCLIKGEHFLIKKKNFDKQCARIEKIFWDFKNSRHISLKNNYELFRWKLDVEISGFIYNNRYYGLTKHFILCDDSVFYNLDRLIDRLIKKYCPTRIDELLDSSGHYVGKKFSKTFHNLIKYKNSHCIGCEYIINFDTLYNTPIKKNELITDVFKFKNTDSLNDYQISSLFISIVHKTIYNLERDLDFKYNI